MSQHDSHVTVRHVRRHKIQLSKNKISVRIPRPERHASSRNLPFIYMLCLCMLNLKCSDFVGEKNARVLSCFVRHIEGLGATKD